jgi:hypothetical protein
MEGAASDRETVKGRNRWRHAACLIQKRPLRQSPDPSACLTYSLSDIQACICVIVGEIQSYMTGLPPSMSPRKMSASTLPMQSAG